MGIAPRRNLYGIERHLVVQYRQRIETLRLPTSLSIQHQEGHIVSLAFNPETQSLREMLSALEQSGDIVDRARPEACVTGSVTVTIGGTGSPRTPPL